MKLALCCIAKMENDYMRDFLSYYLKIGIDKVFIYDNNDPNYETLTDRIKDFINDGFAEIIDIRGGVNLQMIAYNDCWIKHRNEFDYIMFFDCDEYLFLKQDTNIKDYLSRDVFKNYNLIHINWVMMNDGDLLKSNGLPLMERCYPSLKSMQLDKNNFSVNFHIKSIIKCHNDKVGTLMWGNPHTPINSNMTCCDDSGYHCASQSPFLYKTINNLAYIKHFHTKTIDEWIKNKIPKGFADHQISQSEIQSKKLDDFFSICDKTKEKEDYIKNIID